MRFWSVWETFNSQPHTRLTPFLIGKAEEVHPFNSQPHTRLTLTDTDTELEQKLFQFTASYEADLSLRIPGADGNILSIHSLIRG